MKIIKFIIIILFLLINSFCFSKGIKWNKVFESDSLRFIEIDNCDSLYCMALAAGRTYEKVVLKSTDAGLTWNYVYKDTLVYKNGKWPKYANNISYPTREFCIIGLDTNSFLKTTDGGITWNEFKIDLPYWLFGFNDIDMYDSNNGVMSTQHDLAISHNGFQTWETVKAPDSHYVFNVEMAAPNSVCVVSRYLDGSPNYDEKFFRSDDGGNTWSEFPHPDYAIPMDLQFVDSLIGYEVGGKNTGHGDERYNLVFKTTDGGNSWFNVLDTEIYHSFGLQKIDFFDKDNGITVGQFGPIFWTHDGGKSWIYDSSGIIWKEYPPTMCLSYIRKDRAIIADYLGRILISEDTTTNVISETQGTNDFSINPNPASDKIKIKFKDEFINSSDIKIFNSYGQEIINKSSTDIQQLEVDVSTLSSGVYFAVINENGKFITKSFVVMR